MPKSTNAHITKSTTPEAEVLVRVEGVSKKFCKDLKRSLWYGIQDITSELFGLKKKEGLRKDEFWAVSEVSFELKRGECLGLIGHNGAGKSTLLKMLNGLIKPDKGSIMMKGRIGALIELGAGFNPILTGRENVFNNGAVLGFTQKEIAAKYQYIVEFAELEEFMDTPVQNYSSGMKVRLGFAVAAQMEPDVLIIDEVLAVGDVGFRVKCLNSIQQMIKNASVIFVSHFMPQIARISTKGLLLDNGRKLMESNDIGKIVNTYVSRFEGGEISIGGGTGDVALTSIGLYDKNNILTENVNYADCLKLKIQLKVVTAISFRISLLIYNYEQRPVYEYKPKNKEEVFNFNSGFHEILVNTPEVTLTSGSYSILVEIRSLENNVILRVHNALKFKIYSDYVSSAENYDYIVWTLGKGICASI